MYSTTILRTLNLQLWYTVRIRSTHNILQFANTTICNDTIYPFWGDIHNRARISNGLELLSFGRSYCFRLSKQVPGFQQYIGYDTSETRGHNRGKTAPETAM
jgi:hypothetical protein